MLINIIQYLETIGRRKGGGGVFLAIKHLFNPVCQSNLDWDSENIWAKVDILGLKNTNVQVCAYHRPNNKCD